MSGTNGLPILPPGNQPEAQPQDEGGNSAGTQYPSQQLIYGIFQNGTEVLTGYSAVAGFNFQRDERVPTYPIEQGGFASYNKVALPFGAKLRYSVKGGISSPNIQQWIAQLEALSADTNLYEVLTPNYTWQNCNVHHYDFKQEGAQNGGRPSGISLVQFDVWLTEIRQPAQAQQPNGQGTNASPTNTGSPDLQAQQNGATVQSTNAPTNALSANNAQYAQIMGETGAPPPAQSGQ